MEIKAREKIKLKYGLDLDEKKEVKIEDKNGSKEAKELM